MAKVSTPEAGQVKTESITFKIEQNGAVCAILPAPLRTFSSGKTGFGSYGKTMLPDGRTLQLSINAVILTK